MSDTEVNQRKFLSSLWKRLQGDGIGAVLVRGASGSFGIMVLSSGIAFGTNVLLARILGVTQYGVYIYALTWINLLAWACQIGLVTSLVRFVSAYNANKEWGLFRGILSRSIIYVMFATVIIGGAAAFVIWFLRDRMEPGQVETLWIGLLILPLIALTGLRHGALRGLKRVVLSSVPDGIVRPLLISVMVVLLYFWAQHSLTAMQVMLVNLIATLIAFIVGSMLLIKALPGQVRNVNPVYLGPEWLKVSLPMFFGSGMFLILRQADVLMIGIIMGPTEAGIYAVVSRITSLVFFGSNAIDNIAAPMISELHSKEQYHRLQRMVTLAARGAFSFTFSMSIGLFLLGTYALSLFGQDFIIGYQPMIILLVGMVIKSLFGSAGFLMSMTGHHTQGAIIVGIAAVLNIMMNAVLIPRFGLMGAAIATAVSNAIWSFAVLVYVLRRVDINPTIFARIS